MKTRVIFKTFMAAVFSSLLLSGLPAVANADHVTDAQKNWASALRAAVKTKDLSKNSVDLATNALPNDVRTQLATIAEDQAQIWADTILEGDYIAENDVLLEGVETVNMNSVFLGYHITYSSLAVDTSTCDPEANIAACVHGKIVESSFVTPNLDSWIRDAEHLAEFVPNEAE